MHSNDKVNEGWTDWGDPWENPGQAQQKTATAGPEEFGAHYTTPGVEVEEEVDNIRIRAFSSVEPAVLKDVMVRANIANRERQAYEAYGDSARDKELSGEKMVGESTQALDMETWDRMMLDQYKGGQEVVGTQEAPVEAMEVMKVGPIQLHRERKNRIRVLQIPGHLWSLFTRWLSHLAK